MQSIGKNVPILRHRRQVQAINRLQTGTGLTQQLGENPNFSAGNIRGLLSQSQAIL